MDNAAAKAAAIAEASSFIGKLNDAILFPLIYLLMGVALVFFIYGAAQYIINANSDQAREQGKQNIMYGIIGFVVMGSAYAILSLVAGTFGLSDELDCASKPTESGCESAFEIPE